MADPKVSLRDTATGLAVFYTSYADAKAAAVIAGPDNVISIYANLNEVIHY